MLSSRRAATSGGEPAPARQHAHAAHSRPHGPRRWFPAALAALFAGLLVWLYLAGVHASIANSDGATAVLEGHSMLSGNPLLHGWSVSLDSFWTNEELIYALATALVGIRPELLHVVPALIAATTVMVGVMLARDQRRGGAAVAGAVTVLAFLAFPTHAMAVFFLLGPLHVGTVLWALGAFWMLRCNRFDWRFGLAVVLLATNMLGDLEAVAYATAPVLLAGLLAMLRRRDWRSGRVAVIAALGSAALAEVVRHVAQAIGSFVVTPATPAAGLHQMISNIGQGARLGEQLLGVRNVTFGTGGVPIWLQRVHLLGAGVVVLCFSVAAIRLIVGAVSGRQRYRRAGAVVVDPPESDAEYWRVDDMLVLAAIGATISFVDEAFAANPEFARYLTASVLFAAVVAGRVVAGWWDHADRSAWHRSATAIGVVAALCFAAGVGFNLSSPRPVQPAAAVARWLEVHHLHNGLGDYWSSAITTVESSGRVRVRPVVVDPGNHLIPYGKGPLAAWFDHQQFQFLIFTRPEAFGSVDLATANTTWGRPKRVHEIGGYDVVVWSHPITTAP